MNKWIGKGRLTSDPEIREVSDGKKVARYTLAINYGGEADFIRCTTWNKNADFAEKYMRKGAEFLVEGRIKSGSYKDRDNKTIYTTDIIVTSQEFCGSKSDDAPVINPEYEKFITVDENADEFLPFN